MSNPEHHAYGHPSRLQERSHLDRPHRRHGFVHRVLCRRADGVQGTAGPLGCAAHGGAAGSVIGSAGLDPAHAAGRARGRQELSAASETQRSRAGPPELADPQRKRGRARHPPGPPLRRLDAGGRRLARRTEPTVAPGGVHRRSASRRRPADRHGCQPVGDGPGCGALRGGPGVRGYRLAAHAGQGSLCAAPGPESEAHVAGRA